MQKGFVPLWLLVGVVVLLIVGGVVYSQKSAGKVSFTDLSQPSQTTSGQTKALYYGKDKRVYRYDLVGEHSTALPIEDLKETPGSFVTSPDGQWLYFNVDLDFYLYNLKTLSISVQENAGPNLHPFLFTKDSKYMILDSGTAPGNRGRQVMTAGGKSLRTMIGSTTLLAPDDRQFVLRRGDYIFWSVPTGPNPTSGSIYQEWILEDSVQEKLLLKGDGTTSYDAVKWLDGKTLLVRKDTYREDIPSIPPGEQLEDPEVGKHWLDVYVDPTTTWWKVDVTTGKMTETAKFEKPEQEYGVSPDKKWKFTNEYSEADGKSYITVTELATNRTMKIEGQEPAWSQD